MAQLRPRFGGHDLVRCVVDAVEPRAIRSETETVSSRSKRGGRCLDGIGRGVDDGQGAITEVGDEKSTCILVQGEPDGARADIDET